MTCECLFSTFAKCNDTNSGKCNSPNEGPFAAPYVMYVGHQKSGVLHGLVWPVKAVSSLIVSENNTMQHRSTAQRATAAYFHVVFSSEANRLLTGRSRAAIESNQPMTIMITIQPI